MVCSLTGGIAPLKVFLVTPERHLGAAMGQLSAQPGSR